MKNIIYILLAIIVFSSCSSSKKAARIEAERLRQEQIIADSIAKAKQDSIALSKPVVKPQKPVVKPKPFNTFSAKLSGSYKNIPISGTVRIAYDSIIWISVTELGIEAARAKLTKDSLLLINKLEKEYYSFSYKRASAYLGLPLSFDFVQNLFFDTTATTKIEKDKITGTIKKICMKIDAFYFPIEVNLNALVNNKEEKATIKIKKHKVNEVVDFPFDIPNNYKVKH